MTSGQLSAGVIAVSSTGWLFQPVGAPVSGSVAAGNGGDITISNAGIISAYGGSAFGIVGLSLGNGGVLTNAPASLSSVQYANAPNAALYSNTGGTVSITNSGTITTGGNSTVGILAVSNGSGGLINNIPNALYSNPILNKENIDYSEDEFYILKLFEAIDKDLVEVNKKLLFFDLGTDSYIFTVIDQKTYNIICKHKEFHGSEKLY
jgi:hypothetical protein